MVEHSYSSLFLEFGLDKAIELLICSIIGILGLSSILKTKIAGFIITVICLAVNTILTFYNDNKMMESLKIQHTHTTRINQPQILEQLNKNTKLFYENIQIK